MRSKKLSIKITIIFISVMIFFTFFSKTINYLTCPKVMVTTPRAGFLVNKTTYNDVNIYYEGGQKINIKDKLKYPLYIKKVYIQEKDEVSKGDYLISFDTKDYKKEIQTLEKQLTELQVKETEFKHGSTVKLKDLLDQIDEYKNKLGLINKGDIQKETELVTIKDAIETLNKQLKNQQSQVEIDKQLYNNGAISKSDYESQVTRIADLKDDIGKTRKQLDNAVKDKIEYYQKQITKLQTDYSYNNNSKIYDGTSLELIQKEIDTTTRELNELLPFKDDIIIKAEKAGIITDLKIEDTEYFTNDPLGYVVSEEDIPMLYIKVNDWIDNSDNGMDVNIKITNTTIKGNIINQQFKDDKVYVHIKPKINIRDYFSDAKRPAITVDIESKSDFYDYIVPSSALFNSEYIYILEENKILLGNEYNIKKTKVETICANEKDVAIKTAIYEDDKVVCGWDRELEDGINVKISLDK